MITNKIKSYTCCFFGHRKINETEQFKTNLYQAIEDLIINKNVNTFLFGSKSEFDDLCLRTVTLLKEKYPYIRRIYVRAEYPHIDDRYKDYLLESYDDTYFPKHIENAGKASYAERNRAMVEQSQYCIVYYDENYLPPRRRKSKRDFVDYQPKSGTKLAYEYAIKKGLNIINVFVH